MTEILYLSTLLVALLSGAVFSRPLRPLSQRAVERITAIVLYLLIFSMGFRIGRTPEVTEHFGRIGLQALLYAGATAGGTILALRMFFGLVRRAEETAAGKQSAIQPAGGEAGGAGTAGGPASAGSPGRAGGSGGTAAAGTEARRPGLARLERAALVEPLRLLAVLVAGVLCGLFLRILPDLQGETVTTWVLYALLFLIGISLARSGLRLRELFDHSLWVLPVGTVLGSLAGGGLLAWFLGQRVGSGLALASGFGWYSLSGVLLIKLDGPTLGATAFLANMFREAIALLIIPMLARTRHPYTAIGVAGATSMDVTLPIIEVSCGPRAVPFAVASGVVLSAAVPILVPLFYPLG